MRNILLLVDMQNGFIAQNHECKELEPRISGLLESKVFDAVMATRFLNNPNSIYERLLDWHGMESTMEQAIPSEYRNHIDIVMDKQVYNGASDESIRMLCRLNDGMLPSQVFIVGMDTDACVLTTAVGLFEHGIRPIVLTRYCASGGGHDHHNARLSCLRRLIGDGQLSDVVMTAGTDISAL